MEIKSCYEVSAQELMMPHHWSRIESCLKTGTETKMGFDAYELNKHPCTVKYKVKGEDRRVEKKYTVKQTFIRREERRYLSPSWRAKTRPK
jgi:hypothetical protein